MLHSNHAVAGPAAIVETTSTTLDWAEHQLRPPTRRLWWWSLPPCTDPGTCLYTASAGQQGAPATATHMEDALTTGATTHRPVLCVVVMNSTSTSM